MEKFSKKWFSFSSSLFLQSTHTIPVSFEGLWNISLCCFFLNERKRSYKLKIWMTQGLLLESWLPLGWLFHPLWLFTKQLLKTHELMDIINSSVAFVAEKNITIRCIEITCDICILFKWIQFTFARINHTNVINPQQINSEWWLRFYNITPACQS